MLFNLLKRKPYHIDTVLVNIERVLSDIKRGLPVILHDNNSNLLIASSEAITDNTANIFFERPSSLIMPQRRAEYIFQPSPLTDIAIQFNTAIYNQIPALLWEEKKQINPPPAITYKPALTLESQALTLSILAELAPSVLCSPLINRRDKKRYLSLHVEDIKHYKDSYSQALYLACTSPIVLEAAKNAQIAAFKAIGSAKEHYAIIIGDITKDTPLVRVHSSCYTGDLLASLACDCHDQLHTAIQEISSYGAGIILYMMQEGRDIGLINKLRAYKLKEAGLDTVDANHALGFENDLRTFESAAQMLKLLQHTTIRLLTSNPKKSSGLMQWGINVLECVPHIMPAHEFNQKYIKTKIDRLGHIPRKES